MAFPDHNYWKEQLPHPYSPNEDDVRIYAKYLIAGRTLLLGCTHSLISLSDWQLDQDPWYLEKTVIRGKWEDNQTFYDNMIGDGVLNFTKESASQLIDMAQKYSKNLIVRNFRQKLPIMQIANYFPTINDLPIKPNEHIIKDSYQFFVWRFV